MSVYHYAPLVAAPTGPIRSRNRNGYTPIEVEVHVKNDDGENQEIN